MQEIDLLKNLNHANIVKYQGFVKTADNLYIILEYCEDVRMKFSWMGPRALAIKRTMAAQTVQQIKMRTRVGA